MKKTNLLFTLLVVIISALFPTTASATLHQGSQRGLITWKNNGDFDAFLYGDIDSISYSKVGLDGKTYPNPVVQVIWTQDSVYRIPIAAIDSVAFKAPETIMKDSLFHITAWHYPYVTDATEITVTFDASIPADSLPRIGQVVVSDTAFVKFFEKGFAGKVVRIDNLGDRVRIQCEEVSFEDIYDQLFSIGKSFGYVGSDSPSRAPKRLKIDEDDVIVFNLSDVWPIEPIKIIEDESGHVYLNVEPAISLDYTLCYNVKDKPNRFKCVLSKILDCNFDVNWHKSGTKYFEPEDPFVTINIPTKIPLLFAQFYLSGFLDLSGSIDLSAKYPFIIRSNIGYDSQEGFIRNFKGSGISTPQGTVELSASVYAGLSLGFESFFINERLDWAEAGIKLKAGPKFTGTIRFESDTNDGLNLYNNFKDSKISVEPLVAQISASVNTIFFDEAKTWSSGQWSVFGSKDYYLFPDFSAPYLIDDTTLLTTDISRNLIFSVTPGIRITNKETGLTYNKYSQNSYKVEPWNRQNLLMNLNKGYSPGSYTAMPFFTFFGKEIEATGDTSTVTIPLSSLSAPTSVTVGVNETVTKKFYGGWGTYNLTVKDPTICYASLINGDSIRVTGRKNGYTYLTLTDVLANDSVKISVTVEGGSVVPEVITVPADTLEFGNVPVNSTKTLPLIVTGQGLTGNLTVKSSNDYFSVTPTTITPDANGNVDTTVYVTFPPTTAGGKGANIYISGGGLAARKKVYAHGTGVVPTLTVNPKSIDFGEVGKGRTKTDTITVQASNLTGNLKLRSTNHVFKVNNASTITLTPINGSVNQKVTVTYMPDSVLNNGGYIRITGGGMSDTTSVYLTGRCVTPSLTVDPKSIDFGTVLLGDSISKTLTITATNLTGNLTVRTTNNTRFKVNHKTSITLTPDANGAINKKVTVTYKPTQAQKNGGYVVISGGGIQQNDSVYLKGVCEEAYITVTPTTLNFGSNLVPGNTYSQDFTLETNVPGTLSYSLDATYPSVFTVPTIKAGNNTVEFCSEEAGTYSGVINIQDEKGRATASVNMRASVVPQISVKPTSHNFGTVVKGYTATKTFNVTTKGFIDAMYLEMASNNSKFQLNKSTLYANSGSFDVTYTPTAAGTDTATVTISSVGPGGQVSTTIELEGKCVNGYITVTPTTLNFGTSLTPGTNYDESFTLETNVPGALNSSLSATYPSVFTVPTIETGNNTVTFNSSKAGTYSGKIIIKDTISGATATINLKATVKPQIMVKPTSHNFGTVVKGYTATQTFNVSTLGFTDEMSLEMASNNSKFQLNKSTLYANSGSFDVTYTPTAAGTDTATVTISSVSPGGQVSTTIELEGKCVVPTINVNPTSLTFSKVTINTISEVQTFTVTGQNLNGSLTITPPDKFKVSPTTITAAEAAAGKTVKVWFMAPAQPDTYSGNITISDGNGGATDKTVAVKGTAIRESEYDP